MSQESDTFRWTAQKEGTARLVAEDTLSDEKIAETMGIDRRTLTRWKNHPEFQSRVKEHLEAMRQAILRTGIADLVNRVQRADKHRNLILQIFDARAKAAKREAERNRLFENRFNESIEESMAVMLRPLEEFEACPGMMTGLIVRKPVGLHGEVFSLDIPALKELRAMEMQIAKELGQLSEVEDNDPTPDDRVGEELDGKLARLSALLDAAKVPSEPDAAGVDGT